MNRASKRTRLIVISSFLFISTVSIHADRILYTYYRDIEVNGITTTRHKLFWTEQRASHKAYDYFSRYYGVKITDFETYLPYDQPLK